MGGLFDFTDYGALLGLVTDSLIAAVVLGVVGGLVGVFVQIRDMQFAVHGISELSFAGASAALLLGVNVAAGSIVGSLIAGALIGALGVRARDRNSVIGVLMPFGLGLGVLFLALYQGRAVNKFGLLTGQIVAVDTVQLGWLIGVGAAVLLGLALIWRPLLFVSADPAVAVARGVPAGALSVLFALLLALAAEPTLVHTKEQLLRDVWGFRALGTTRTLDSHACRLRQKLGRDGDRYVINVWGVGYRLVDGPVEEPPA